MLWCSLLTNHRSRNVVTTTVKLSSVLCMSSAWYEKPVPSCSLRLFPIYQRRPSYGFQFLVDIFSFVDKCWPCAFIWKWPLKQRRHGFVLHKDVRGTDGVFGWQCIILLFSQMTLCDLYTPINALRPQDHTKPPFGLLHKDIIHTNLSTTGPIYLNKCPHIWISN